MDVDFVVNFVVVWNLEEKGIDKHGKRDNRVQCLSFQIGVHKGYLKGLWWTPDQNLKETSSTQCSLGCWWLYVNWYTANTGVYVQGEWEVQF